MGLVDSGRFPLNFDLATRLGNWQWRMWKHHMKLFKSGVAELKVVHRQDLNKKILISLIVASTLLAGILLFSPCFWIYRLKTLKKSAEQGHQKACNFVIKKSLFCEGWTTSFNSTCKKQSAVPQGHSEQPSDAVSGSISPMDARRPRDDSDPNDNR
ncbi:uncharacterized protein LOC107848333 isoform X2 [Capsicum annuum]|uniref:uncharacterized protein LOC107848333 isoform X2 n=1 Tax=Capsicum annuum TaxID=4072 RepID=UPI001FB0A510|nr:uncharacterized protein LOC107848333 isoform X2 [Capsicum annuum]